MPIAVRSEDEITWIRLAEPERGNAVDDADLSTLRRTFVQLGDVPPRVVILEASGPDFCTGLHLEADNAMLDALAPLVQRGDRYALQERLVGYRAAIDTLGRLPSVTIAAIRGRCIGIGLELAIACDVRIAGDDSSFSLPGATLGMQAWGGGLVRLTRLLGRTRATDLALTGRSIDAPTAERWGLVSRVVSDPDAVAQALALALRRAPHFSMLQTVLTLRTAEELTERSFNFEAEAAARSMCRDMEDGIRSWRAAKAWKPLA